MIFIIILILIISLLIGGFIKIYCNEVELGEPFQDLLTDNITNKNSLVKSAKPLTKLPINSDNVDIPILLDEMNRLIKKNIEKERVLKLTKKKNTKCKFFPSYSQGFVCPEKYTHHSGASFGAPSGLGLLCNGKKIKSERARVYGMIKNGSIVDIKILKHGSGYIGNPKIKISGNGHNAEAISETNDKGGIAKIKIVNPGQGYTETPKIKVEKPNGYMYCHLCCNTNHN